jgi:hypothetical protein
MSLEKQSTMKPNCSVRSEGRWDWIRTGKGVSSIAGGAREFRDNRCHTSNHRHGGVCVVGMSRSDAETSREIPEWPHGNGRMPREVGMVHSSVDASVMGGGAKGPYLVGATREAKDVRWPVNGY